jgi:hypothetical protein
MFTISNKVFECDRYKKLYEREKRKTEELERQVKELRDLLINSMDVLKVKS